MSVVRYDQHAWPESAVTTPEGFLKVNAPLTRMGVLKYEEPGGAMRGELRHPDDWGKPESVSSFASLPVTDGHPPPRSPDGQPLVDAKNAKRLAVGWTGENVRVDGSLIRSPMVITDAEAVAKIRAGKRGTSTGVLVDLIEERGTFEGADYSYRQVNPRGNHIAIVDSPRAGTMIRLDGTGNQLRFESPDEQESRPMVKIVLDGISYDAAPEVANALTKAQGEAKELQARLDSQAGEAKNREDALRAERDTATERVAELEGRDIRGEVKARVALESHARQILPESEHAKLDSLSDQDIRRACVAAKWPTVKLDDKSETYIATRFEIAVEEIGAKAAEDQSRADALGAQRAAIVPKQDGSSSDELEQN